MRSHSHRSKENLFLKTTGPGCSKGVVYSVVRFVYTYPLDSDLSDGQRYLPFGRQGLAWGPFLHIFRE